MSDVLDRERPAGPGGPPGPDEPGPGGGGGGGGDDEPRPPVPWYRRTRVVVAALVLVFAVAAVVTDLPTHQNPSVTAQTFVTSLESYATVCTGALHEAFQIEDLVLSGHASHSDRAEVPSLLRDDVSGCSYTNENLTDMQSELQPPGGKFGQQLGLVDTCVAEWEFPDANEVITALSQLLGPPTDSSAVPALRYWLGRLATDSARATDHLQTAAEEAKGSLTALHLPSPPPDVALPGSGGGHYKPPTTVGGNPCTP